MASRFVWEEIAVISLEDCIGLCGLTKDEVLALAEHEHIPEIYAAALAQYLLGQPDGCRKIGAMIADDINGAIIRGDRRHADELLTTLEQFVSSHPEALASRRVQSYLRPARASVAKPVAEPMPVSTFTDREIIPPSSREIAGADTMRGDAASGELPITERRIDYIVKATVKATAQRAGIKKVAPPKRVKKKHG
jgi:hypothetical protein